MKEGPIDRVNLTFVLLSDVARGMVATTEAVGDESGLLLTDSSGKYHQPSEY